MIVSSELSSIIVSGHAPCLYDFAVVNATLSFLAVNGNALHGHHLLHSLSQLVIIVHNVSQLQCTSLVRTYFTQSVLEVDKGIEGPEAGAN